MLAGANWSNGANSGSRSRNANNYRWNLNSNIGCRGRSDTGIVLFEGLHSWPDQLTLSKGKTHNGGYL